MKIVLLLLLSVTAASATGDNLESLLRQLKRVLIDAGQQQAQPKECGFEADIVMILDASSSIIPDDYQLMKRFARDVIGSFDLGEDKVRVGLIAFNQFARIAFNLDKITEENITKSDILDMVDTIITTSKGTLTHKALEKARTEMFQPEAGDRVNVTNLVIIVTDGRSNVRSKTAEEALYLRQSGALVFAIAVGRWDSSDELQLIASKPTEEYIYTADNFDGLDKIKSALQKKTCEVIENPPKVVPECNLVADIVFMIDSSSSIDSEAFDKAKRFLTKIPDTFIISPEHVRVAVVTFDKSPRVDFHLNEMETGSDVRKAIEKLEQYTWGTRTDRALKLIRTDVFNPINGDRDEAPNLIILLTDGRSTRPELTIVEADAVKEFGATIITIGVGKTSFAELETIASDGFDTEQKLTFEVDNFDELKDMTEDLALRTCLAPKVVLKECDKKADVMFILDLSSGVGDAQPKIKTFMEMLLKGFKVSVDGIRMGIITFNRLASLDVKLSDGVTKDFLQAKIDDMKNPEKIRNTFNALKMLRETAFLEENGGRSGVSKIAIVLTFGKSQKVDETTKEVDLIHEAGIKTFAVTVGKVNDKKNAFARPSDLGVQYQVKEVDQMFSLVRMLREMICSGIVKFEETIKRELNVLSGLTDAIDQLRAEIEG